MVVLVASVSIVQSRMWRRPVLFLFHVSFVVILCGALLTSLFGKSGKMHLQQGVPSSLVHLSDSASERLPFLVRLDSFRVHRQGDVITDYESALTIHGATYNVRMNHVAEVSGWRFYQSSYDADEQGTLLSLIHDPWGIGVTYCGYFLLFATSLWLLVRHLHAQRKNVPFWTCFGVAAAGASCYVVQKVFFSSVPLLPILRSPYLIVHVSVIIMAYLLIVMALWRKANTLLPAALLLACGIFIGAMWANVSWGPYWSWDAKESWALITMVVIGMPLHARFFPWFEHKRRYTLYLLFALVCLAMTYLGVNYLLGGLHSYGA